MVRTDAEPRSARASLARALRARQGTPSGRRPRGTVRIAARRGGGGQGRGSAGERGIALILTLLVLSILIVLVVQFTYSTKVDDRISENFLGDQQIYFACRGGVPFAKAFLKDDQKKKPDYDTLHEDWAKPPAKPGEKRYKEATIGDCRLRVRIVDEERKVPVNNFAREKWKKATLEQLQNLLAAVKPLYEGDPDVKLEDPKKLAEQIQDLIDKDQDGQYEQGAKNKPIQSLDELLAIEGVVPKLLYGFKDKDGKPVPGLADFFTPLSGGKVNINTAPQEVLEAALPAKDKKDQPIDRAAMAKAIVDYRGVPVESQPGGPAGETGGLGGGGGEPKAFEKVEDLSKVPGLQDIFPDAPPGGTGTGTGTEEKEPAFKDTIDVKSKHFLVEIVASRDNLRKQVSSLLRREDDKVDVIYWREYAP